MFRIYALSVVLVFLMISQLLAAAVEIDEPDWQFLVEDLHSFSSEYTVSVYQLESNDLFLYNDELSKHQKRAYNSSSDSVKYAASKTANHSKYNTPMHESLLLFFFGTGVVGLIRIGKKKKAIFVRKNEQLSARVG